MTEPAFKADPYSYEEARRIADELELSDPVAITLVRRGYRTPEAARSFLDADEAHEPSAFTGIDEIVTRITAAISAGQRITIHGDYDVDGVCSTSIMVSTLRRLGADCDWFIPDRMGEGYGLSGETLRRLAGRGTGLVITVDCGITAVAEAELAAELGIGIIVTDHHQPAAELPSCPILHPAVCGYPFTELCGTAVAWKLASALAPGDPAVEADLDLVALATVADVVPLVGENRNLVRRGLAVARRARRPGLRALIAAAGIEPERLDEGDFAFRLAPRINAAGRLYRADAGVELMLTDNGERAAAIAEELNRANGERRATEREVEQAAEAALRALPDEQRDWPGIVVAGRGWHPGVIGIVASRLAERHWRPTVVIALDDEGGGRGSGRSVPGFDLLAALERSSPHLRRFGGHRAAAGLEIDEAEVEGFRASFASAVGETIGDASQPVEEIDAVVGGTGLGLPLAEEIGRLAPFGAANPGVRLLVPSARLSDVRPMGEEGRHSRFSLESGSHRALGVAFGRATLAAGEEVDAAVRLEVNRWNGAIEPRLVLRELYPSAPAGVQPAAHSESCGASADEWWLRLEAELEAPLAAASSGQPTGPARTAVEGSGSVAAVLAELISSGEAVLAVCADASRRAALASAAGFARFGGAAPTLACGRCADAAIATALAARPAGGLVLADHAALARAPLAAGGFEHVVLVDPAPGALELAALSRASAAGNGFLHYAWGEAEAAFALEVVAEQLGLRSPLAALYRALRAEPCVPGRRLRDLLAGEGAHRRSPELAGRCLRVLFELGLVERTGKSVTEGLVVVSSEGTELERSDAFRAYAKRHQEAREFLERRRQP